MRKILIWLILLLSILVNPVNGGSSPPSPWTQLLHTSLTNITKLRVRSGGTCHRNLQAEKLLVEIDDAEAIIALIHQIAINDSASGGECKCCGNPTLEFYRYGELVASLSCHHGRSLRWPGGKWPGDGELTSKSAALLNQWLAERGIPGPQREYVEAEFLKQTSTAAQQKLKQKWLQAMPASLKPFWPNMEFFNPFTSPISTTDMYYALALEFPNQGERVRALLAWYGSGAGSWSVFPAYEGVAAQLLLCFETSTILAALEGWELSEPQTEGTARLFAGWTFSHKRPHDLRLLPGELKRRLLEYSLRSKDQDKRTQAQTAFAEIQAN